MAIQSVKLLWCARRDNLAALRKPRGIGWENDEQTKLTMKLDPAKKELQHIQVGIQ